MVKEISKQTTDLSINPKVDFSLVLLSSIKPDPNQPRKYFNEHDQDELTDSIREKGVLQPILLRNHPGGGYMLVCGERRYRAALSVNAAFKERNTIPAVIRSLSDDEALELQIIENLQRKDVHPMEEAVAFKSLFERGKDIKEIAARVGKKEYYVRQRLKLNELIKEWQSIFYEHRISAVEVMHVASLDAKSQAELYNNEVKGREPRSQIKIGNWTFQKYTGNLLQATFPLDDTTLDKKAGSCISCQFNSAYASLFPESEKNPVCSNRSCFKHKSDIQFDRSLKSAKEDPELILVVNGWSSVEDNVTRSLEKEGHKILNGRYSGFEEVEQPEKPNLNTYDEDNYSSRDEMLEDYETDLKDYEKDLKSYEQKISGGKYKKAFVVAGNDKGQFIYIQIGKPTSGKSSAQKTKEKEASGELTAQDIELEIKRIQEREKRNKELDINKVHVNVLKELSKVATIKKPGLKHQGLVDRGIMVYLLVHEVSGSYQVRSKVKFLPVEPNYSKRGYSPEYFESLGKISDDDLAHLVRLIVLEKWGRNEGEVRKEDTAAMLIAKYAGVDVGKLQAEQAEVSAIRIERMSKRISQLQGKKRELVKPKKSVKELVTNKKTKSQNETKTAPAKKSRARK